jgi:peroxiredoxin
MQRSLRKGVLAAQARGQILPWKTSLPGKEHEMQNVPGRPLSRQPRAGPCPALPPGTPAPDFTLHTAPDQTISLHDFQGQPVILAFYPADWSPVCRDEMMLLNEALPEFHHYHAELMGISVDGVWCHIAFAKDRKLRFPLLSDFEPKGEVARAYGVYRGQDGTSERALFLLDAEGKVQWSYISPVGVNPGVDGILHALKSLASPTPPPVLASASP